MIVNISYKDKEVTQSINSVVGKPFSIVETIRLRGIGSQRLLVSEASEHLFKYFKKNTSENFCNIELRPEGIIVRFRYIMDVMAWVIPFHRLSLYKSSDTYSIHADGNYLKVIAGFKGKGTDKFISKLLDYKNKNLPGEIPTA